MTPTRVLDLSLGVPGGLGEYFHCPACGSLLSPGVWPDSDCSPCPACGRFRTGPTTTPQPSTALDAIGLICSQAYDGAIEPTMRELAAMILDELPSFREGAREQEPAAREERRPCPDGL